MTETQTTQLSEAQKLRFSELCSKVKNGSLSANKAYQFSQADGAVEEDKGFKGTFKSWVETAIEYGWLDKPSETTQEKPVVKNTSTVKQENKTNYVMPIIIGAGIALVLIYAIKKYSKKD